MMFDEKEIKEAVRERYGDHAQKRLTPEGKGHILDMEGRISASDVGYSPKDLSMAPKGADLGLSCGNPLDGVPLAKGQTVLDLGCGGGMDCFIAAEAVGPTGRVIGVDMTPQMIALAQKMAANKGSGNVEFRLGEIESLPVADASVDVVISNCTVNLVMEKACAFAEALRVLRPGGLLAVADIVTLPNAPEKLKQSKNGYTACLAGAVPKEKYLALIHDAGFRNLRIAGEREWPFFRGYVSVKILAERPTEDGLQS